MNASVVDAELFAGFRLPNPEFSPVPIWWWSGDALDLSRMIAQIDELVDKGVFNAVVLNLAPSGPVYGSMADDPPFLTDDWWSIWVALCAHCELSGMRLWFYDQIGFSGANLQGHLTTENADFVGRDLMRVTKDVDGEGTIELSEAGEFIAAQALPLTTDGQITGPPIDLEFDGRSCTWNGQGPARLTLAYALPVGFDYHSPEACQALMGLVHYAYEQRLGQYFGSVVAGSFQDELPNVNGWSSRFAAEFEVRKGYDIRGKISALWEDWGLESARVRLDYQHVRSALAEAALFKPISEWHERHGLLIGADQQSPARSGEPISAVVQYADYMRTHRWYSAPGSDHHGDAKIHSSLAHSYGRPRTWIEAFHSSGWGGTLEETFDWLQPWLLAGANLYDPHAVYYSTKGGQWEWAPPSTCWRQPYWRHYRYFADAVSRLCWAATRGSHVCDVALLFPSATVQADLFQDGPGPHAKGVHDAYSEIVGRMEWFNTAPGALKCMRRDFDVLDDDTIARASARNGVLYTHDEAFGVVVLPAMWMIETDTVKRLVEFCDGGGTLVAIGGLPEFTSTEAGAVYLSRLDELATTGQIEIVEMDHIENGLLEALAELPPSVKSDSPVLHRKVGDTHLLFVTASKGGQAFADHHLAWATWDYEGDISWSRYSREMRENGIGIDLELQRPTAAVTLPGEVVAAEQWDPATGTARPVSLVAVEGGTQARVTFDISPMVVLVWKDAAQLGTGVPAALPEPGAREIDGAWSAEFVQTLDNRHGDFRLPAHPGPVPVTTFRLDHCQDDVIEPKPTWFRSGTGWLRQTLTDGPRAWVTGPRSTTELPPAQPPEATLDVEGWDEVRYSLSNGIDHDPQHDKTLGPKSRVLEPLMRVKDVDAGHGLQVRTCLPVTESGMLTLAVGANAVKDLWWNGESRPLDGTGYVAMAEVQALTGLNRLELRLTAPDSGDVEAYWALTSDAEAFRRPEWITPATDPVPASTLSIYQHFEAATGDRFETSFASVGPCRLKVNGREAATHGAFGPYSGWRNPQAATYDLTDYLEPGSNRIEAEFIDDGLELSVLIDALLTAPDGSNRSMLSNVGWRCRREGEGAEIPLREVFGQRYDARFFWIRSRPHPLPRTDWLDESQPTGGVLDVVPDPYDGVAQSADWFRIPLPPGARSVHLPILDAEVRAFNERGELAVEQDTVELPAGAEAGSIMLIRVVAHDGRRGGAVFDGPITFDVQSGLVTLGDWQHQGLENYSGGLTYRLTFDAGDGDFLIVDLGSVRGTAEVMLNGQPLGVRVWSPYRFDVSSALLPGSNEIKITVFNTLAPYMKGASPTSGVYGGQEVSGLFGPVTLGR